jgi:hypothetical protein
MGAQAFWVIVAGGVYVRGMARDPSNPHDMFFRNMLGRPEDAGRDARSAG